VIIFIFGTTAEAIKLAPIARLIEKEGGVYEQWLTMFHGASLLDYSNSLGFRGPVKVLPNGNNGQRIRNSWQTLKWLNAIFLWALQNRKKLVTSLEPRSLVMVHGDTLTTVLGGLIGRMLGIPVAHVEAGLRSGSLFHPFPEEIDRIVTSRLATIHYAPSKLAAENLGDRPNVVNTFGNTIADSVIGSGTKFSADAGGYGVCLLHRLEFLGNIRLVTDTLSTIDKESPKDVLLFLDEHTSGVLAKLIEKLNLSRIKIQERLPHGEFIEKIAKADFVITDSGGIQEECAMLGVPTLVHRKATERQDGLGKSVVLSKWSMQSLSSFLGNYSSLRMTANFSVTSPSKIVVEDLRQRGFLGK
jgi:UDP-N-acetylglucosamine 2-epimerase (non-hydrolysing)